MSGSRIIPIGVVKSSLRSCRKAFSSSSRFFEASAPTTSKVETAVEEVQTRPLNQAPNREGVWARSQNPRSLAMTGPRFEQTDFDLQPQPLSAMEMVHKQPVQWTHNRIVACEGGGGSTGHPRIFINTDKPEISVCNYCGLPFANEHHKKHLETLHETSYPLS